MTISKKVSVLALSLILGTASLPGCGNASGTAGTTPASSSPSSGSASPASATPKQEDKELYEFTIFGSGIGNELKKADNAYIAGVEKALNLKLNVEIPPASSYVESLQMMIASGQYAELFNFPDGQDKLREDAAKNSIIIPLNQYLENCPNLMQYTYDISWSALKVLKDDNIYGVPRTSIARADGFVVRKDWLEKVGFDFKDGEYMTLDQLEEMATLITFNDPDGNGVADTYGLGANSESDGTIKIPDFVAPAFGLTGWKEYNGEYMNLMYSQEHDNFKRALEWTQKAWKKGIIDPDWPTIDRGVTMERFTKGSVGMYFEFAGHILGKITPGKEIDPDFNVGYITGVVENAGDKYTTAVASTGFWGSWHISSSAKKPERIMEFLDYILSDDYWANGMYGYEGITYEKNGDEYIAIGVGEDNGGAFGKGLLRRNNDPNFFISLQFQGEERSYLESLIDKCIKQYEFPLDGGFRPEIANDPIFIDYDQKMRVQISKILVGDLDVSEWDGILQGWYDAGGDKYIRQMQDHIASTQK